MKFLETHLTRTYFGTMNHVDYWKVENDLIITRRACMNETGVIRRGKDQVFLIKEHDAYYDTIENEPLLLTDGIWEGLEELIEEMNEKKLLKKLN